MRNQYIMRDLRCWNGCRIYGFSYEIFTCYMIESQYLCHLKLPHFPLLIQTFFTQFTYWNSVPSDFTVSQNVTPRFICWHGLNCLSPAKPERVLQDASQTRDQIFEWSLNLMCFVTQDSRSLRCCPLCSQIFPEIQTKYLPKYISSIPWRVIFFRSSGWNLKSRVSHLYREHKFTQTGYPPVINSCGWFS